MSKTLTWLQDNYLTQLQEKELNCTIITRNGVHMKGKVLRHDKYVILIETNTGIQSLIYKHAVSTIR